MEIRNVFDRIRRGWLLCLALTLLGALAGFAASALTTRQYTASTQVFLSNESGDGSTASDVSEVQLKSYATAIKSDLILKPAAKQAGLDSRELDSMLAVEIPSGTSIIQIDALDANPEVAAKAANAVAKSLQTEGGVLYPNGDKGKGAIKTTILSAAVAPTAPSLPHTPMNLAVGLGCGAALGILAAVARGGRNQSVAHPNRPRVVEEQAAGRQS